MRQDKPVKYSKCGLRTGGKYERRTAGGCWAMCNDGFLLPPFEMADAESTRMTMLNIVKWFEGYGYKTSNGNKLVMVYDDMCHLLRCVRLAP